LVHSNWAVFSLWDGNKIIDRLAQLPDASKGGTPQGITAKKTPLRTHTSTRNSGVIHGGIYYEPGSLKAKLCVRSRHLTYEFLRSHNIPHWKYSKIIVAQVILVQIRFLKARYLGQHNENITMINPAMPLNTLFLGILKAYGQSLNPVILDSKMNT
jgi:hypothetical protein